MLVATETSDLTEIFMYLSLSRHGRKMMIFTHHQEMMDIYIYIYIYVCVMFIIEISTNIIQIAIFKSSVGEIHEIMKIAFKITSPYGK